MVAMELQADGWYLRNDIVWHKPNCQPESVKDRFTVCHEYILLLSKEAHYFFNQAAIAEPQKDGNGKKNKRTVWSVNTEPFPGTHFAVFPKELVRPCLLASSRPKDLILDPFFGTGTVGVVAQELKRRCVGIEIKADYVRLARKRLRALSNKY
jgi:site-specific DNA-methyltransferase (cytosine-N4-specific)